MSIFPLLLFSSFCFPNMFCRYPVTGAIVDVLLLVQLVEIEASNLDDISCLSTAESMSAPALSVTRALTNNKVQQRLLRVDTCNTLNLWESSGSPTWCQKYREFCHLWFSFEILIKIGFSAIHSVLTVPSYS